MIKVHLQTASSPKIYEQYTSSYVKAGFYCVLLGDGTAEKYPLCNIHCVTERYHPNAALDGEQT